MCVRGGGGPRWGKGKSGWQLGAPPARRRPPHTPPPPRRAWPIHRNRSDRRTIMQRHTNARNKAIGATRRCQRCRWRWRRRRRQLQLERGSRCACSSARSRVRVSTHCVAAHRSPSAATTSRRAPFLRRPPLLWTSGRDPPLVAHRRQASTASPSRASLFAVNRSTRPTASGGYQLQPTRPRYVPMP